MRKNKSENGAKFKHHQIENHNNIKAIKATNIDLDNENWFKVPHSQQQ